MRCFLLNTNINLGLSVFELIIGIIHLIDLINRFKTAFVKGTVMRHKGQAFNQRFYLTPHLGKYRRSISILMRKENLLVSIFGLTFF